MPRKTSKASKTKLNANLAVRPKDRRADFVRLAEGRTFNAIKAIQLIGNLSNINDYDYGEEDVKAIISSIKEELQATEARFQIARQKATRKPVKLAA